MPKQATPHQTNTGNKPVIGLMGGPGSGKSSIASLFAELGCAVIDADQLAHQAMQLDSVRQQVRSQWGDEVFDEQGGINRKALGRLVFADPAQLRKLEAIIHPIVHQGRDAKRKQLQTDPSVLAIIEDCPLLLETKLDQQCDALVFVDTPDDLRLNRVSASRGWDREELEKRDLKQLPLDIKRQAADYVISNDQDFAQVREQVRHVLKNITHQSPE